MASFSKNDLRVDGDIDMVNKSIINAAPTKELFISMLIRDVTLRDAIGDLLDNCIDGALRLRPDGNYKGLRVDIELDITKNYFQISDNCGGIPVNIARDYAFRFGRPDFDKQHTDHSVGVFGIGMKRALFKLGKVFVVKSKSEYSSFEMAVDVAKWKDLKEGDLESWQFKFTSFEEDLKKAYPQESRGTVIYVTDLNDDVLETFKTEQDIDRLIEELEREHIYSIDKGLRIRINHRMLKAPGLKLLVSEYLKPAVWENLDGKVKVRIIAGVSEQEKYGPNGGWYVFCNKRLVLGPDQTKDTGWGASSPIRIPDYHPQFYRFRGYAFLDADDPRDLPWNTTKTNMDLDSPVYRTVLQQMVFIMRTVIDFLNGLHDEKSDYKNGEISETPLQNAIDHSKLLELNTVIERKVNISKDKFSFPDAAKPTVSKPKSVWIRYEISDKEYEAAKAYFEKDKPGEIGREIFDYFFVRELDNQ
jgi:hypothetical protein